MKRCSPNSQRSSVNFACERSSLLSAGVSVAKSSGSRVELLPFVARSNLVVATRAGQPNVGEALAGVIPFTLGLEDFVAASTPRIGARNAIGILGREEAGAHRSCEMAADEGGLARAMSLAGDSSFRLTHRFDDIECRFV